MTYLFRNNGNTNTISSLTAEIPSQTSTYTPIVSTDSNIGMINFNGKTTAHMCYIKNARLMPLETTNSTASASISCDLLSFNNFHINTSATIATINLTNPVVGQSGHIVINNTNANTHGDVGTALTWQLGGNSSYVKFSGGTAPTLTTTTGKIDVISYYILSSTCAILCSTLNH
jgi:hypothetical protein